MTEKEWFHNGLRCFVLLNYYGAPCGYVEIPGWSALKYEPPSKLADMFDDAAYLGVTYTGSGLPNGECKNGCFYIGFDMMHGCDVRYEYDENDYPQIIKWALAEGNGTYPVPVIYNASRMRHVLNRIKLEA